MIQEALHLNEASTTESAITSDQSLVIPVVDLRALKYCWLKTAPSASWAIFDMIETDSTGYSPLAVSPESITQSAPSRTALAISETSARVGVGLENIDSSIWVAQITGLPITLHLPMIIFWARKTFSAGISIPISPRATIIPSEAVMTSSIFLTPS